MDNYIFAFIGIAASGKTELGHYLIKNYNFVHIPSVTSRPKRPHFQDEYKHVTKKEFENLIKNNELLEYTIFNNDYYGKLKSDFEDRLSTGHCVYTITPDRAKTLKDIHPKTKVICVKPEDPILENVKKRLHARGFHTKDQIESKIKTVETDLIEIQRLVDEGLIDHFVTTVESDHSAALKELDKIISETF